MNSAGSALPGFPLRVLFNEDDFLTMATVGDLNNDGQQDFVVAGYDRLTNENKVWVFFKQGTTYRLGAQWTFASELPNTPYFYRNRPAPLTIADLFMDGYPEIIGFFGRQLHVWNSNGEEQSGFPFSYDSSEWTNSSVAIANLDRNSPQEIVAHLGDGNVVAINASGNQIWQTAIGRGTESPVIGDVDGDLQREIVAIAEDESGSEGVWMFILSANGTIERRWQNAFHTYDMLKAPTLVRLEKTVTISYSGMRKLNIVTRNYGLNGIHQVYAFNETGVMPPRWPYPIQNGSGNVTALNLCNDRNVEILGLGLNGHSDGLRLVMLSSQGRPLQDIPLATTRATGTIQPNGSYSAPVLADLDRDGKTEVIFTWSENQGGTAASQIHGLDVFEVQAPSTIEWGQFQNNFSLTGSR